MEVLKCDICKKEFAEKRYRWRTPRYAITYVEENSSPLGRIIDLCPECEAKLFEYLRGSAKEEKDVEDD